MHIPDNYLSPATCAVMGAAMVPVWSLAIRHVKKELPRERVPLLGIGAAFAFLIMMFNVPVPGGTTAHAVGGTLIAVLLGPWAASIAVSVALLIQALLFGDGGILAYGANAFNMAFVIPFVGYFVYRFVRDRVHSPAGEYAGLALGSYLAVNLAALCAAIEFGLQPLLFRDAAGLPMYCPYPLAVSIPAMLIPHLAVAGIVEAAFTVAVVSFVRRVSPETMYRGSAPRTGPLAALVVVLICLSPLGLLAAGTAWGEWGADEIGKVVSGGHALGFVPSAMKSGFGFEALMQDYGIKGLPAVLAYIISAIAGAALLVIVFKLVGLALGRDDRRHGI
ncbi:MAG TPA: cobalt transporter CbiM [Rectinemataceae bacterium]|nr:cobalt transporter CbiM [Rectinemataceae bacterium]